MRTTVEVAQRGFSLSCDYHPIYTYATLAAKQQPVSAITLQSLGTGAPVHGILGLAIPEMDYFQNLRTEELGGAIPSGGMGGVATELNLEKAIARIQGNLEITLDEEPVGRLPVAILPTWQWSHGREARLLAAAYVLPGDEVVSRTVSAASGRLEGLASLTTLVRQEPRKAGRLVLDVLYRYLSDEFDIGYEAPLVETDDWSRQSYQRVRSPQDIFFFSGQRKGRGNCFDLSLFFAGCLESLGLKPLILFTGGLEGSPSHAFVGCWLDGARRFQPFITDPRQVAEHVSRGDLLLLEATGVARGSTSLSFKEAEAAALEHLARGPVHALDIAAVRPPIGVVRPIQLANAPIVQHAFWASQNLAAAKQAKLYETLHLLYGLCSVQGELTRWVLERAGSKPASVCRVIEQSLPVEDYDGVPVATKNYEICTGTARGNARSEGRSTVEEVDLLWAVIENPSRNVRRILEATGCDYATLVRELDRRWKRPGEMSIHRAVRMDSKS